MVDSISANVFGRQANIENELNDHRAKIQEIETLVVKSVTNANKTVEGELSRFEKILAVFEKFLDTRYSELNDKFESLQ